MGRLAVLLVLLACPALGVAAPVPSGRPDSDGHVTGYVSLQGHRFALPGGVWTFVTGQRLDNGDMFRVFLARVQDRRLTGILELADSGSVPRRAGPSGLALVCTAYSPLGVASHQPAKLTDDDRDCVRLDVDAGTEATTSRDPLVVDFVAQIGAHDLRMPATELFVMVTVRTKARRFDAKFWFDSADAGFAGQPVAAWTSSSARQDVAKVAYVRRLAAWGETRRGLLLSEAAALPALP